MFDDLIELKNLICAFYFNLEKYGHQKSNYVNFHRICELFDRYSTKMRGTVTSRVPMEILKSRSGHAIHMEGIAEKVAEELESLRFKLIAQYQVTFKRVAGEDDSRSKRVDKDEVLDRLRAKISNGYAYKSTYTLQSDFGGTPGFWSKHINANPDLKNWSENRDVRAGCRANLEVAVEPEIVVLDEEVDKILVEFAAKSFPNSKTKFDRAIAEYRNQTVEERKALAQLIAKGDL